MDQELFSSFPMYGISQSPYGNIALDNTRDLLDSTLNQAQQDAVRNQFITKNITLKEGLKQFESKVQERPQVTSEIATNLPRSVVGGTNKQPKLTQGVSQLFAIKKRRLSKYA